MINRYFVPYFCKRQLAALTHADAKNDAVEVLRRLHARQVDIAGDSCGINANALQPVAYLRITCVSGRWRRHTNAVKVIGQWRSND